MKRPPAKTGVSGNQAGSVPTVIAGAQGVQMGSMEALFVVPLTPAQRNRQRRKAATYRRGRIEGCTTCKPPGLFETFRPDATVLIQSLSHLLQEADSKADELTVLQDELRQIPTPRKQCDDLSLLSLPRECRELVGEFGGLDLALYSVSKGQEQWTYRPLLEKLRVLSCALEVPSVDIPDYFSSDELLHFEPAEISEALRDFEEHVTVISCQMLGASSQLIEAVRDVCQYYDGFANAIREEDGSDAVQQFEHLWMATIQGHLFHTLRHSTIDNLVFTFLTWLHDESLNMFAAIRKVYVLCVPLEEREELEFLWRQCMDEAC